MNEGTWEEKNVLQREQESSSAVLCCVVLYSGLIHMRTEHAGIDAYVHMCVCGKYIHPDSYTWMYACVLEGWSVNQSQILLHKEKP